MKYAEGMQESWLETIRQHSNSPARFQIVRAAEILAIGVEVGMLDEGKDFKTALLASTNKTVATYRLTHDTLLKMLDILQKHWYYGPQIPTIKGEEDASTNPPDTNRTNIPAGFSEKPEQDFIPNTSGSGGKKDR